MKMITNGQNACPTNPGTSFSQKKKAPAGRSTALPRAWFHYLPLFATNHSAVCCYLPLTLPLLAANPSTICVYLPLTLPLFAANSNKLSLFDANDVYRKLPIRVI
jgi:hypothetical protein